MNWWNQYHIDPLTVASALWTRTRLPEQSQSLDPIEKPQPDTLAPMSEAPLPDGIQNLETKPIHTPGTR